MKLNLTHFSVVDPDPPTYEPYAHSYPDVSKIILGKVMFNTFLQTAGTCQSSASLAAERTMTSTEK